jgi:chromosome segregation ATPase
MGFLTETSTWEPNVYQIETTDAVSGGTDGVANIQPKQLADRTRFLKDELDVTNSDIANIQDEIEALQSDVTQINVDLGDRSSDISDIRSSIASIQANRTMQGIEGEQFFFAIAF